MDFAKFIVYLKENGYVFLGSKIYGGLANSWDFGPIGIQLKKQVKNFWWQNFINEDEKVVGIDSSIILSPKVWEASGHLKNFNDPLMDCINCKRRFRADKLIEDEMSLNVEGWSFDKIETFISEKGIGCPGCKKQKFTSIRNFNLMFPIQMGLTKEENTAYLRPETAQGIFINFNNIVRSNGMQLPFGVGQIGKSFRNEITAKNFIFRTKEFEQMEIEFFFNKNDVSMDYYEYYIKKVEDFLLSCGLDKNKLSKRTHGHDELSHYSSRTFDFEFNFPFGKKELCGVADRGSYDFETHNKFANEKLFYLDPQTNKKIIPNIIEPSIGVERLILAILLSCYKVSEDREWVELPLKIAPYQVGICPLIKKHHKNKSKEIFKAISKNFRAYYLESGNIGKRYKKFDKWGVPFVLTVDDESLNQNTITIRNIRDKKQSKIGITKINEYLRSEFNEGE